MASIDSATQTVTPFFQGVYLHLPTDPEGTLVNFLYWDGGRSEEFSVAAESLQFAGREFPVMDFGTSGEDSVGVAILVPSGPDHDDDLDLLRSMLNARTVVCYRDNRSRKVFGAIVGYTFSDVREGTKADFTVRRVDYTEVV